MSGRRREEKTARVAVFFLITVLVTALDQFTKFAILRSLSPGDSIPVIPSVFSLTLVHNRGIAFGLFRHHPEVLFTLITASIIILSIISISSVKTDPVSLVSFALILGGAAGNWLDRVRHDAVIDFLDFHVWPVFNLADTAISVGVGLFIISRLFFVKKASN